MVREMYRAVGEFEVIGGEPEALTARAIFAALVLDILGEERLRPDDAAFRKDAVDEAFREALSAGVAAFDAAVEAEDPCRELRLGLEPGVKNPLGCQAYLAWKCGLIGAAVSAFPEPAFGCGKLPSRAPGCCPIDGMTMQELWRGLLPPKADRDWAALAAEMEDAASVPVREESAPLMLRELAGPTNIESLRGYLPPRDGAAGDADEILPFCVRASVEGEERPVQIMKLPYLSEAEDNADVKLWKWYPWRDCVAAEAWISLENGVTINAVAPFYCHDKAFIWRGMPCSARLAFFAVEARHDVIDGEFREYAGPDGLPILMKRDFTYTVLASRHSELTDAWYSARALVEDVQECRTWNGETVLRCSLQMRDIPQPVPTYVHQANVAGGVPKRGDALQLTGWFYVDVHMPRMSPEDYEREYPDGLAVPDHKAPGSVSEAEG